jgi:hypothetical protein
VVAFAILHSAAISLEVREAEKEAIRRRAGIKASFTGRQAELLSLRNDDGENSRADESDYLTVYASHL